MSSLPLSAHILLHLSLAILIGSGLGWYFKRFGLGLIIGIIGGFLIDLDHVLEYFLVLGWTFNLTSFFNGKQFLLSNHIFIWFHAWEYIIIFFGLAIIFRRHSLFKMIFITLAITAGVHLATDCLVNQYPFKYYSLIHRYQVGFATEQLLSPIQYQENMDMKDKLGL